MHAIRPITSYPSEEEVLQQFNAYVRGPMRENLLNAIGSEVPGRPNAAQKKGFRV